MSSLRACFVSESFTMSSGSSVRSSWRASLSWQMHHDTMPLRALRSCMCTLTPSSPSLTKPHKDKDFVRNSMPISPAVLEEAQLCCNTTTIIEELHGRIQRKLLKRDLEPMEGLNLIDTLQRLGIAYYFDEEIDSMLEKFAYSCKIGNDLSQTALLFRLLRQKGCHISSDIFCEFTKNGKFKKSLSQDVQGMLNLYEASYLGGKDEDILSKAMEFTKTHLTQTLPHLARESAKYVRHSLELPRHHRMERLEARNYIDVYNGEINFSPAILELAKLEFNRVQSLHQSELNELIQWWRELGLIEKLPFARDRPLECFLWTVGIFPEPQHSNCRIELAKTIAILLVLDDVFDTYGSLDELILFNDAIKRWDVDAIEELPEYMKICYMALNNTINDISFRILKEHGLVVTSHLKRTWVDMIEGFLVEAKWFNKGYVPNLEEYMENGITTAGTYMALVHTFFLVGTQISEQTIKMMQPYPKLFSCAGRILRLWDDLGTAKEEQERGDVASSMECHMREQNITSDIEAREHVKQLIQSLWRELNGELVASSGLPLSTVKACFNVSRTSRLVYQNGDDDKAAGVEDHVKTLLFTPIMH